MTELDKMLSQMDSSLFSEDLESMESCVTTPIGSYDSHEVVHQENISNELAKEFLDENEYDANCRYQLIFLQNSTVLVKINDRAEPNSDNPVEQQLTEYVLDSEDVQTYEELMHSISLQTISLPTANIEPIQKDSKVKWWVPLLCMLLILFGIGVALIYFVMTTM